MSEKLPITNLYYEIALLINKELNDAGIITHDKYYQVEKNILKEKNK